MYWVVINGTCYDKGGCICSTFCLGRKLRLKLKATVKPILKLKAAVMLKVKVDVKLKVKAAQKVS